MKNKRFLKMLSTCFLSSLVLVPLTSCQSKVDIDTSETSSDKVKLTLVSKTKDGTINSIVTQLVKTGSTWRTSNKVKPSVEGYVFKGWFLDESFIYEVDDGYILDSDTTFYAKYVLESNDTPDEPDEPNSPETPDTPVSPDSPTDDKTDDDEDSDYVDFSSLTWDETEVEGYSQKDLEDKIKSFLNAASESSVVYKTNAGEILYSYDKENRTTTGDYALYGKGTNFSESLYVTDNRCYYKNKKDNTYFYEADKSGAEELFTK